MSKSLQELARGVRGLRQKGEGEKREEVRQRREVEQAEGGEGRRRGKSEGGATGGGGGRVYMKPEKQIIRKVREEKW